MPNRKSNNGTLPKNFIASNKTESTIATAIQMEMDADRNKSAYTPLWVYRLNAL
jgi:hypothetical protein